jgi:hypothetical protein
MLHHIYIFILVSLYSTMAIAESSISDSVDDDSSASSQRAHVKKKHVQEEDYLNTFSYSFNMSSNQQTTNYVSSYLSLGKGLTFITQGNLVFYGMDDTVNSANIGLEAQVLDCLSVRVMATGTAGHDLPFAMGSILSLTTSLNKFWDSKLSTSLVVTGAYDQSWLGATGVDPFSAQQQVYDYMASVGMFQAVSRSIELGLTGAYYGFVDSRPGRYTLTLSFQGRISKSLSSTFSVIDNDDVSNHEQSFMVSEAIGIDLDRHITLGIHGSAFQQGADSTGTSGVVPAGFAQRDRSLLGPTVGAFFSSLGYAGGLDLTFHW